MKRKCCDEEVNGFPKNWGAIIKCDGKESFFFVIFFFIKRVIVLNNYVFVWRTVSNFNILFTFTGGMQTLLHNTSSSTYGFEWRQVEFQLLANIESSKVNQTSTTVKLSCCTHRYHYILVVPMMTGVYNFQRSERHIHHHTASTKIFHVCVYI